jgi:hypothetical protein
MKSIKLRSKMHLTDEHMKVCIWIVTTEIQPDIAGLIKQKQCLVSH